MEILEATKEAEEIFSKCSVTSQKKNVECKSFKRVEKEI